jgi:predicted O-methyltransferase YrrM
VEIVSVRALLKDLAPTWVSDPIRGRLLARRAARLQQSASHIGSIEEAVEIAFAYGWFYPNQIRSEITQLLHVVAARRPRRILEIGSQGGGNLFLFSKAAAPDAKILSIDLNFSAVQMAAYPSLAAPPQELTCFKGDSHAPEMLLRVKAWLGSERLDFLFIDGDHSLEGVAADYHDFAPLVAPGGLIGFHDIVPDYTTRYGRKTIAYAGDAPIFWNQLKATYPVFQEFVADPGQDGAGIGLVTWRGHSTPLRQGYGG